MGNKNAKLNDRGRPLTSSYSTQSITNAALNSNDLAQFKLRKKHNYLNSQTAQNGSHTINRSCSSPSMATKWRPNSTTPQTLNGNKSNEFTIEYNSNILPSSPFKLRPIQGINNANKMNPSQRENANAYINYNQEMRTKQKDLANIIKKIDSNQPSYHTGSKLYKPSSFLLAKSQPAANSTNLQQQDTKSKLSAHKQATKPTSSMSPSPNSSSASSQSSLTTSSVSPMHLSNKNADASKLNKMSQLQVSVDEAKLTPAKQVRISPKVMVDSSSTFQSINDAAGDGGGSNTIKSKSSSKIAKKFGISPKLKRKIVETIANRVKSNLNLNIANGDSQSNNKFNQARFLLFLLFVKSESKVNFLKVGYMAFFFLL
jgi:hypothetical protein